MAIICGLTLIAVLSAGLYFRSRPPEMSGRGLKHFKTGLLFAIISSGLALGFSLFASHSANLPPSSLLITWVWMGNLSSAFAAFCFLRELVQLIPGVKGTDITPEGMIMGSVMCVGQIFWILSSLSTVVW